MLKGAIIGTGKIALTGHMPAYDNESVRKRAEIVAAADSSQESRKLFSKQYPGIHIYASTDELFDKEKLDFVDICVPPNLHNKMIQEGVAKNVHIICEKPFALTVDDANAQMQMLRSNGLIFMPCHQYRYSAVWTHFKNASTPLGAKDATGSTTGEKCFLQFNVYRTEADRSFTATNPYWRTDKSVSGGGILADTGVHYIYLSLWMLGKPLKVSARTFSLRKEKYEVEDTAVILIELEKGTAEINLTWAADKRYNSACLVSQSGSVSYNGNKVFMNDKEIDVPDASDKSTYISYYVSLINDFIDSVKGNKKNDGLLKEAYDSIRVLDACYRSAESGKTVEM
jgi:predicted dehydrogenase